MAPQTPTVLALKQDFITAQTRLLSQPVQPSRAWRRGNEAAEDNENDRKLSEKAVDDALFRLNHTLQQHNKRVYPPQATRLIAEQIDQLYLTVGDRRSAEDEEAAGAVGDEEWKMAGADYTNAEIIASLPPTWDSERQATEQPLEAKRYADLAEQLQALSTRKAEALKRVQRLRRMRAMLAPFDTEQNQPDDDAERASSASFAGSNGVQQNLVTRDGEVEKELERMRMLLVRVGDKVARLKPREGSEDDDLFGERDDDMMVEDVEVVEKRKVEGLLDAMG